MNRIDICKNIIQSIKEYITNPAFIEAHREQNHFIRSRKLSMLQVIIYLFYSSKACLNINLSNIITDLSSLKFPSVSKQALSKARQFINPALFRELFFISVDLFYKHISSRKTWHNYHVFAIDGSKIELPNSKSNFETFGEMFGYPDKKRKFTLALASMVYDVLDDYIVHASFTRYLSSERAAAVEHMKSLEELNIYHNSIIVFDRGYYSEQMFRYCVEHNHFCLMRLKECLKLSKACNGDLITTLPGDSSKGTKDIKIRVIEVILNDGSKEYLATNLFDNSITREMFRELYFLRWPVELKYKELKSRFKLEEFVGATSTAMLQEFFINLLYSNIASLIKNEADEAVTLNSKPSNKHRYQANRSFVIGRIKNIIPKILCDMLDFSSIALIYQEACIHKSQIMPGRSYKRKNLCRKGRTHFNNLKTSV